MNIYIYYIFCNKYKNLYIENPFKISRKPSYFKLIKPFYNDLEYPYVLKLENPILKYL